MVRRVPVFHAPCVWVTNVRNKVAGHDESHGRGKPFARNGKNSSRLARGGTTKIIAFIAEFGAVDRIIDHMKLTFAAAKPPPPHVFEQVALIAAEKNGDYF